MKLLAPVACLAALPVAVPFLQSGAAEPSGYAAVLAQHVGQEFQSGVTPNGLLELSLKTRAGQVSDAKLVEVGEDYLTLELELPKRTSSYPLDKVVLVVRP